MNAFRLNNTKEKIMTKSEVTARLTTLKNTYPAGSYWNHQSGTTANLASVSSTPCGTNNYTCNSYAGGIQCYAFAYYMANLVFGNYPAVGTAPAAANGTNYNGWKLYTNGNYDGLTIEPGDIIRTGTSNAGHSAIVWKVNGETVTVAEVWGGMGCKIAWGNFNGNSSNTATHLKNSATYIIKAPKDNASSYDKYTLKNVYYSTYLTTGDTTLYNNKDVTVGTEGTRSQDKWAISSLGTGVFVHSSVNTNYGLNVYRSGDPYNCDVHIISGNETDAKVNFIRHSAGYYMIKLTNYNLYLTASGTNACWKTYGGESDHKQMWYVTKV